MTTEEPAGPPPALADLGPDQVVEADVRADLRAGREPFGRIMAARQQVPPGGVLVVRAIFEPVPLYGVLGHQGFDHFTERLADDDWRVWFFRASGQPDRPESAAPEPAAAGPAADQADVVVLDVRDLEPPEPMVQTLAALETLPPGATLLHLNVRVPQFLLPELVARGFAYEVREQEPNLVRVFIRRKAGG